MFYSQCINLLKYTTNTKISLIKNEIMHMWIWVESVVLSRIFSVSSGGIYNIDHRLIHCLHFWGKGLWWNKVTPKEEEKGSNVSIKTNNVNDQNFKELNQSVEVGKNNVLVSCLFFTIEIWWEKKGICQLKRATRTRNKRLLFLEMSSKIC